ncbi:ATP-dependent protease ATPase subunit HslU [Pelagibacteraceae bacterium]|nr:ATP-dependent protease ATPase subunit HslU [Pelagibacteraceae bacterium]
MESSFSPREIVSELDKFIIGQNKAKRAVAVALRNRWRRKQLDDSLKEEIVPKNILMVGPTGCGKTEISRRLAKLANAPFVKVEATKFTEVGYVGRDVEQIIRDLVEISITKTKIQMGQEVKAKAEKNAEERILDVLVSKSSTSATRDNFRKKLRSGELNDNEVEIPVSANANLSLPTMDIPGMPGSQMGMINLGDVFGKGFGNQKKMKKMSVKDSHTYLLTEETEKLLDKDKINSRALEDVEQNGIVFIDEIDKITSRAERSGADVSREGVQRDLLPLIEGTAVTTKYGVVKTDYILFIASGAFHLSKPSDMLPELQGRLPIRVELDSLSKKDFKLILTETQNSLIKQYQGLLGTEKVDLKFEDDGIDSIASLSTEINQNVENIGARRLHTVMEKLLEEVSYTASDIGPTEIIINKEYVENSLGELIKSQDLSKFIL